MTQVAVLKVLTGSSHNLNRGAVKNYALSEASVLITKHIIAIIIATLPSAAFHRERVIRKSGNRTTLPGSIHVFPSRPPFPCRLTTHLGSSKPPTRPPTKLGYPPKAIIG